ncbi:MAG: hypothetical protein GY748_08525 [Planctomycetaceae bacterium]|nr:hypothetical protein [Planctomycetaceae bacterium]MCP4478355.1 hypothetical protein [Planctomycetaceae bacterium]
MFEEYGTDVQFFMVYCREAHAIDGDRPMYNAIVEEPVSTEERNQIAKDFVESLGIKIPTLLDKIDDKTGTDYAAHPDRLYLIGKDGRVAYAGGRGPSGFKPDELRAAIRVELGGEAAGDSGDSPVNPPVARRSSMHMPVIIALDLNKDGKLSVDEIEGAPKSLKTLDKNSDGNLSKEELRPSQRGRSRRSPRNESGR